MNIPITLLQSYQFTIEFSVILLSSDGPKQVNYSIHSLSTGLSFRRETLMVPEDHPHLAVWSCCMQTPCAYVCVQYVMTVWVQRHVGTSVDVAFQTQSRLVSFFLSLKWNPPKPPGSHVQSAILLFSCTCSSPAPPATYNTRSIQPWPSCL